MSKKVLITLALLLSGAASILIYNSDAMREARFVKELVARNVQARGGADAWQGVSAMRLEGEMDLGKDMVVPYSLDQQRPGKMCLEFIFDGETAVQCADGKSGWKIAPFLGRNVAEPMDDEELRETIDSTDLYGPLYKYSSRGHDVAVEGLAMVDGREAWRLKVTLPRGAERWVYLDAETALDVKLEVVRTIGGREHHVETYFYDWVATDGLLISRRQETGEVGATERRSFTVDSVVINPDFDDTRFAMPKTVDTEQSLAQATP